MRDFIKPRGKRNATFTSSIKPRIKWTEELIGVLMGLTASFGFAVFAILALAMQQ